MRTSASHKGLCMGQCPHKILHWQVYYLGAVRGHLICEEAGWPSQLL